MYDNEDNTRVEKDLLHISVIRPLERKHPGRLVIPVKHLDHNHRVHHGRVTQVPEKDVYNLYCRTIVILSIHLRDWYITKVGP